MGNTIRDRIDSHSNLSESGKIKETVATILMAMAWYIWLARNDFIFNSILLDVDGVVEKIRVNPCLWLKYRANR